MRLFNKIVLIALLAFALLAGAGWYWHYSHRYVSTEDAYLNANVIQIASRVTGQVAHLYVENNQFVAKDQILFELDPALFQAAVDKAKAQLAIDQANLQDAKLTDERVKILVAKKMMPEQSGDDAKAKLDQAIAAISLDKANLQQAELDLTYTQIKAPTAGWVTNMSLREGNTISANQPVFALISNNEFWVDTNFKETEMEHIRPGQAATIEVDMYPNHPFKGVVESISGGSGAAFSLLPPQNATGNWVKVTQRVPVRVKVIDIDPQYPLRIGTTATVTVDLHSARAPAP